MNLLIIGNGFDLAHKLPTTYSDVLDFLHCIKCIFTDNCEKQDFIDTYLKNTSQDSFLYEIILDAYDSRNNMHLNPSIQEICKNLNDNVWFTYLYKIYLAKKMRGINWIDFEKEISFIIEQIDRAEQNLYLPFKILRDQNSNEKIALFLSILSFKKYLSDNSMPEERTITFQDFLEKSYSDLRRLIRCIEIYLVKYVETKNIQVSSPDIIAAKPDAVLCFNYTHTFVKNYPFNKLNSIHYIHGETHNFSPNNMVLGIDEYSSSDQKNTCTNYNIYKKFTQRILNDTGFNYRHWIKKMDVVARNTKKATPTQHSDNFFPNNVYIFGHSLDITDADILKDLIDRSGVKTTIFYFNKQQQVQQISNLVKMLGQEKFIQMINSVPQQICFIQQRPMDSKNENI